MGADVPATTSDVRDRPVVDWSAVGPAGSDVAVRGGARAAGAGVEAFLAAARGGDFDALLELLDPT